MQPDRFARSTPSGSRLGLVRPGMPLGVQPTTPMPPPDGDRTTPPDRDERAPADRAGALVSGDQLDAFAAAASLRLAGTLNLRRTLGLTLSLAVPQLADWASVELEDGTEIRGGSLRDGRPGEQWSGRDAAQAVLLGAIGELSEQGAAPTVLQLPLRVRGRELGRLTLLRSSTSGDDETARAFAVELADRAALALDAARVYEERTTLATTLRDSLRPDDLPQPPDVRLGARYRAAEEATEIGGDFYDVYRGPEGQWWFAVGDVCGKGVDAAVLTGRVRSGLHMAALAGREPDVVLDLLNEVMLLEGGTEFVTLVVGRLGAAPAPGSVELTLSGGGHLPPLVLRTDGSVEAVATGGVLVGMLPEARFGIRRVTLGPGEVCLFYTDGVTEATDRSGAMFGPERLERLFADCRGMPPQAVAERVEQNVLEHLGGRPHDDIAVFAIGPEDAGLVQRSDSS